jgi:hypothetical protein
MTYSEREFGASQSDYPKEQQMSDIVERQHEWIEKFNLTICKECLVVKRADGNNKPCKGAAKLGLRDDVVTRAFINFARREAELEAEIERLRAGRAAEQEYWSGPLPPKGSIAGRAADPDDDAPTQSIIEGAKQLRELYADPEAVEAARRIVGSQPRSLTGYFEEGDPLTVARALLASASSRAAVVEDVKPAMEEALTALCYHMGGNLSPATAKEAVKSLRRALRALKGGAA